MSNSTDSLWKLNASDLIPLLRKKEISPREILDSSINRINQVNPSINAIVTLCIERAKKNIEETAFEENSILCNLPVLVKDITEVEGVKTTYGSKLYENYISKKSDILISNIEKNGGVILGKTNTPELAAGSNTFNDVFGTTKNAWNLKLSAGGSSGGSAAALASGMAWFSTGTDLGGSLRNPSSWNGVVGLRPTPGLVAQSPSKLPFNSLSLNGPMARNVDDLSIFLDSMADYNLTDPLSFKRDSNVSFYKQLDDLNTSYKVGITADFELFPCSNEIKNMINNTSKLIESLGYVIDNTYPSMNEAEESFQILRAYMFYSTYGFLLSDHHEIKQDIIWNINKGKNLKIKELVKADTIRAKLYQNVCQFFQNYDFLVCPSSSVVPFTHETKWIKQINNKVFDNYVSWLMICGCLSLVSCPIIAIPTSISENGAPIGIQIMAKPHEEAKLLKFAKSLESQINISTLLPVNPSNE